MRSTIPHSRPSIGEADRRALEAQLSGGMLAEGERAAELERALAARFGFADAVAVGSGSQALLLALRLRGVRAGARVILPAYVCPEVLGVVEALGAEPVLADIGEDYTLSAADAAFQAAHDAVILPYLFGQPADPARFDGARLVADWAQYLPVRGGVPTVDVAVLSFEATKLLAGGEGGAVLVRNGGDGEALRAMKRVSGSAFRLNLYPMSDMQAALLLSQLGRLDAFLKRRIEIASRYDEALRRSVSAQQRRAAPFRYVVRTSADQIEAAIGAFAARGVIVRRPVNVLLHRLRPCERSFPVAERSFDTTLSLPLYPALTDTEVERVAQAAREVLT